MRILGCNIKAEARCRKCRYANYKLHKLGFRLFGKPMQFCWKKNKHITDDNPFYCIVGIFCPDYEERG